MKLLEKMVDRLTQVDAKQVKKMMRVCTTLDLDEKSEEYFQKIADEMNAMRREKKK